MIDLSSLNNKVEDGGTTNQGRLTADEFNLLANATIDLQDEMVQRPVSITVNRSPKRFTVDSDGNIDITVGDQNVVYNSILAVDRSVDVNIVSVEDELLFKIRYSAVRQEGSIRENANIDGILVIERRVGSGIYSRVGEVPIASRNEESTTVWDTVDIGKYLIEGEQQIRLKATFEVLDNDGNVAMVKESSSKVYNITHTSLGLEFASSYWNALDTSDDRIELSYKLKGEVDRKLHIKITGSEGTYTFTDVVPKNQFTNFTSTKTVLINIYTDSAGILTHGVKKIEAWLTCSDGVLQDAIESEHTFNQMMVWKKENDNYPYILVQNVRTGVKNYVGGALCSYVLFNPNIASATVEFSITNYIKNETYFNLTRTIEEGIHADVVATLEIENSVDDNLFAYLNITADDVLVHDRIAISVDNKDKFAPTPGADFVLNPKIRNNNEDNPFVIINSAKGSSEVESAFSNFSAKTDLWVEDADRNRVLRVLAGQRLEINYDWLSAFATDTNANATFEIDFKVSNITQEDKPIIKATQPYGDRYIGFKMNPLEGVVYTISKESHQEQNFLFMEGARTHILVNVVSQLVSSVEEGSKPLPLCRIFVNGVICREFLFDNTKNEWYNHYNRQSWITIGNEHADIDIYSMRVYKKAINSEQALNNYVSTLPTAEKKINFKRSNAVLDGSTNLVNANLCQANGMNTLIWHGEEPTHNKPKVGTGWWEINVYDDEGRRIPEYSGDIAKRTKSIAISGQGTTAKTYYYFNVQTKLKDLKQKIQVEKGYFHEDIKFVGNPYEDDDETSKTYGKTLQLIYGCGLGKNDWASTEERRIAGAQPYEVVSSFTYSVPDGWFDGNNKYRGKVYKLPNATEYSQKLVNKINYASSMQSHLMGSNNAYNDLHKSIVGNIGISTTNPKARVTKIQDLFMYFTQAEDLSSKPIFKGPGTFGPGKMDDATMGFDKKEFPNFCMLEGADNNLVLTDFRTPWESKNIEYDLEYDTEEGVGEAVGFKYKQVNAKGEIVSEVSFDLDKFVPAKTNYVEAGKEYEVPNNVVLGKIRDLVNFIYTHSPRIKVFIGSWDDFLRSENAKNTTYKWWCTLGDEAFKLRRYNEFEKAWVEAGWDETNETTKLLRLNDDYSAIFTSHAGKYEEINELIIEEIANHAKSTINNIIFAESLKFHYCFVNSFLAGTDNCSKNTYYILIPDESGNYKWALSQDDMDTIFATDNSGFQTKPYYIDRMHPSSDEKPTISLYQGDANNLFDLEEAMYEKSGENKLMFKQLFNAMSNLCKGKDKTVWGFLNEYFFSTQKRIPAVIYNETARIRYEYPTSIGYISDRNVNPITQSMGDQLLAEQQYMLRRVILFASYAGWGDFERSGSSKTGLEDARDVIGIQGTPGQTHKVEFKGLIPHQYMYINGMYGTTEVSMGVRCKPGLSYDFKIANVTGDTACSLYGAHLFRDLGNLGGLSVKDGTFTIKGKRLTSVVITPEDGVETDFRPTTIVMETPLVERINMVGSTEIGGNLDVSRLVRLRELDVRDTNIADIIFPVNDLITSAHLGRRLNNLRVNKLSNLSNLTIQGYANMMTLEIIGCPLVDSRRIVSDLYTANPTTMRSVSIDNIDWSDFTRNALMYLCGLKARLTGVIRLGTVASTTISMQDKIELTKLYGNIDRDNNSLYVTYIDIPITAIKIVSRDDVVKKLGVYDGLSYTITPMNANNIEIIGGVPAISFSLQSGSELYAEVTDPINGIINVKKLSNEDLQEKWDATVSVQTKDGGTLESSIKIGFYSRIPKVGDFAFSDGTFDNVYNDNKTLVGIVFNKKVVDDSTVELLVDSREDIQENTSISYTANVQWGININNSSGLYSTVVAEISRVLGVANAQSAPVEKSDLTSPTIINESTYIDDSTSDGYNRSSIHLSLLEDNFCGKEDTAKVVERTNRIYREYIGITPPTSYEAIRNLVNANNAADVDRKIIAYENMLHLATYVCYLYEPRAEAGKPLNLHEEYQKGKWYLPSIGELARIYNFFRNSSGNIIGEKVNASYANESFSKEARMPIYANALKRLGEYSLKFTPRVVDNRYWSSSENAKNVDQVHYINFKDGNSRADTKRAAITVRPICKFTYKI